MDGRVSGWPGLPYADQTVGPNGRQLTVHERIADVLARRGPDSPHARAHYRRGPYLLAVAARVNGRLTRQEAGRGG